MNKVLKISLISCLTVSVSYAEEVKDGEMDRLPSVRKVIDHFGKLEEKEVSAVDKFKSMFTDGKVSGQIRSMYAGYDRELGENDYATAIGGQLKYELASFNGFNAGFAVTTSQDINFATGSGDKQNSELSSSTGEYTELSEAYINYKYEGLNLRAGRQVLDTPLADSDDIRMVPNSFEAYIATYELSNFVFTAGNLQKWQGVDAGLGHDDADNRLDSNWINSGDNGTWLGGVTYSGVVDASCWYYDIDNDIDRIKATYVDFGTGYEFSKDLVFHANAQYLNEQAVSGSSIEADIYGALVELEAYGFGFNVAYNYSAGNRGKSTFSGMGGGSLYTSMDTMIIDEITEDRDAQAIVAGIVYEIDNVAFLYAYGDFSGDSNSIGEKAHIVEQDIGVEYNVNDEFVLAAIVVLEKDKESALKSENDWNRAQVVVKYDF